MLFVGITGFVWQGVFNFYVTYLGAKGVAPGTANTLLTVTFAAGVPSFVVAGRLADRFFYLPLLTGTLVGFVGCLLALAAVSVGTLAGSGVSYTGIFQGYAALVGVLAVAIALLARAGQLPTGE